MLSPAVPLCHPETLHGQATLCRELGDYEGAREALCTSLQLARVPQVPALHLIVSPMSDSASTASFWHCILPSHPVVCRQRLRA